ncbi:MAG: hypothetical protein M1836_002246 [Candelina mexicana]|nr:MAG: hypothetical protein M1836_002246 [Candelina mexicana]
MAGTRPPEWMTIQPDSSYHGYVSKTSRSDGLSLYRALSRQTNGDPQKYKYTLNSILDHFLRVWADPNHSLHDEYTILGKKFSAGDINTFFGALACPDVALGRWDQEQAVRKTLLNFIANALNIRITIWVSAEAHKQDQRGKTIKQQRRTGSYGDASFPIYHILATPVGKVPGERLSLTHFDSLLPDETGRTLIHFLMKQKVENKQLKIREMHWWWEEQKEGNTPKFTPEWFNEYEQGEPPEGLPTNDFNAFSLFTLNVTEPQEIRPALDLLDQALRRAPGQETAMSHRLSNGNYGPLRRYLAIDAEFLALELPPDFDYKATAGDDWELQNGQREHLCGILTIAVDRHFVVSFYVLHMLQTAGEDTVRALCTLFERIIFNTEYLKFWWNFQSDFKVLNATIAHMFQGTPRSRFKDLETERFIEPTFKISSKYLNEQRPMSLTFRTDASQCHFHTSELGTQDLRCPCYTGNLELSTVLDYVCHQLLASGYSCPGTWAKAKMFSKYHNLLKWWYTGHRLGPILDYFKEAPFDYPGGQDAFYPTLAPGMEIYQRKMGYNIGDVVGLALIVRFLLTSDDRPALATRLINWSKMVVDKVIHPVVPVVPRQSSKIGNFPLIDDHPRCWQRQSLDQVFIEGTTNDGTPTFTPLANQFRRPKEPTVNTLSLSYVEHEERAAIARIAYSDLMRAHLAEWQPHYYNEQEKLDRDYVDALDSIHAKLFDPTKFSLPSDVFTVAVKPRMSPTRDRQAIVRAGMSHSDDLIKFIRSSRSAKCRAPLGFMSSVGKVHGLPQAIGRIAGESLTKADQIWTAFEFRVHNDPPPTPVVVPDVPDSTMDIVRDAEQELIAAGFRKPEAFMTDDLWVTVGKGNRNRQARARAAAQAEHEEAWYNWQIELTNRELDIRDEHVAKLNKREAAARKDELEGQAGRVDRSDLFDPEERSHKRDMERSPRYNAMAQYRKREVPTSASFAGQLSSRVAIARRRTHQALKKRLSNQQATKEDSRVSSRKYECDNKELHDSGQKAAKLARVH